MNQQAAAAAEEAQLAVDQSKLPLFHADPKKDQFTGDQWLERFENIRQASNWNEQRTKQRTKSYFYNALRALCNPQTSTFINVSWEKNIVIVI